MFIDKLHPGWNYRRRTLFSPSIRRVVGNNIRMTIFIMERKISCPLRVWIPGFVHLRTHFVRLSQPLFETCLPRRPGIREYLLIIELVNWRPVSPVFSEISLEWRRVSLWASWSRTEIFSKLLERYQHVEQNIAEMSISDNSCIDGGAVEISGRKSRNTSWLVSPQIIHDICFAAWLTEPNRVYFQPASVQLKHF